MRLRRGGRSGGPLPICPCRHGWLAEVALCGEVPGESLREAVFRILREGEAAAEEARHPAGVS